MLKCTIEFAFAIAIARSHSTIYIYSAWLRGCKHKKSMLSVVFGSCIYHRDHLVLGMARILRKRLPVASCHVILIISVKRCVSLPLAIKFSFIFVDGPAAKNAFRPWPFKWFGFLVSYPLLLYFFSRSLSLSFSPMGMILMRNNITRRRSTENEENETTPKRTSSFNAFERSN